MSMEEYFGISLEETAVEPVETEKFTGKIRITASEVETETAKEMYKDLANGEVVDTADYTAIAVADEHKKTVLVMRKSDKKFFVLVSEGFLGKHMGIDTIVATAMPVPPVEETLYVEPVEETEEVEVVREFVEEKGHTVVTVADHRLVLEDTFYVGWVNIMGNRAIKASVAKADETVKEVRVRGSDIRYTIADRLGIGFETFRETNKGNDLYTQSELIECFKCMGDINLRPANEDMIQATSGTGYSGLNKYKITADAVFNDSMRKALIEHRCDRGYTKTLNNNHKLFMAVSDVKMYREYKLCVVYNWTGEKLTRVIAMCK